MGKYQVNEMQSDLIGIATFKKNEKDHSADCYLEELYFRESNQIHTL